MIELSKPEILRVIEKFETATLNGLKADINFEHQESSIAEQRKFLLDLRTLLNLVEEEIVVNPYKETGSDLVTLDTGEVMDPEISKSLDKAPKLGQEMFNEFVRE